MNSLSDTLTMGIVLALVFGALSFYLYSRLLQVEKRMSLTENLLLDLKMATENTLIAMGSGPVSGSVAMANDEQVQHLHPVSGPEPVPAQEVEELHEEDFYKSVLASTMNTELPEVETEQLESVEDAATRAVKEIVLGESAGRIDKPSTPVQVTKVEPNYESLSLKELKAVAKQKGITVNSHAGKKELIDALKKTQTNVEAGSPSTSSFPIEGAELIE